MPRIEGLARADAPPEIVEIYDRVFGPGRDPVAEPGTSTGTPGHWWTVLSRVPAYMSFFHRYSYQALSDDLRGLVLARTGYLRESQFVFSQHCKGARNAGVDEVKIRDLPFWETSDAYSPRERAILAFTDSMCLQEGRVSDGEFDAVSRHFDTEEILNFVYYINLYILHATMCRALRLEYDDIAEPVVEVPKPEAKSG